MAPALPCPCPAGPVQLHAELWRRAGGGRGQVAGEAAAPLGCRGLTASGWCRPRLMLYGGQTEICSQHMPRPSTGSGLGRLQLTAARRLARCNLWPAATGQPCCPPPPTPPPRLRRCPPMCWTTGTNGSPTGCGEIPTSSRGGGTPSEASMPCMLARCHAFTRPTPPASPGPTCIPQLTRPSDLIAP